MEDEKENITVTVDIEAKSDNFGLIKPHNEKEIKRDHPPHNVDGIIISICSYLQQRR
jgi:hypothetical protein